MSSETKDLLTGLALLFEGFGGIIFGIIIIMGAPSNKKDWTRLNVLCAAIYFLLFPVVPISVYTLFKLVELIHWIWRNTWQRLYHNHSTPSRFYKWIHGKAFKQ